ADLAGVSLADGVGGQQSELPGDLSGSEVEEGDEVGVALGSTGDLGDEVFPIVLAHRAADSLATEERWVPHYRVESPRRPVEEHLRKGQRPVERWPGWASRWTASIQPFLGPPLELPEVFRIAIQRLDDVFGGGEESVLERQLAVGGGA